MVTKQEIEKQLKAIGANFNWWGKAEAGELEQVIIPGEQIMYCINGRYEGGFAMLCITNQRAILIDKKPFYLTIEDIRYDMISELDFDGRLVDATLAIYTPSKTLRFTALKVKLLRQATAYLQGRVIELRMQITEPVNRSMQRILDEPATVVELEHMATNPYTKVPLMMKRRISRNMGRP